MNIEDRTLPVFLSGGGEVGKLIRSYDWSATPLGPPEQWPQSLKTAVSIVLRSSYPMFIWWGPELITIYNDAYVPLMGYKHPAFLGKPANELWSEIWETSLLPMKNRVFEQQESIYGQDLMLLLERKEFPEEAYFNFSYSPIIDESGQVGGLFCACHEETDRVLQQRRLQTLHELNRRLLLEKTVQTAGQVAVETLGTNVRDIPFAAFYLLDSTGEKARLVNQSGIVPGDHPFRETVSLTDDAPDDFWKLPTVAKTRQPLIVEVVSKKRSGLTQSLTNQRPNCAYILPVQKTGPENPVGILIVGLSPYRDFDANYRNFLELTSTQMATALGAIEAYESELKRAKEVAEIDQKAQIQVIQSRQQAEEHIRSIIEQAPVGIAVLQGDRFVFEAANAAYLMLIDKSHHDVVGRTIQEVLPELQNQGIFELLDQVIQTGESFVGNELPVILNRFGKDENVYFNFVYQPLREANQSVSGIIVVAHEVTSLVKSRLDIERQFRDLVIKSPIAMSIFRGPEYIIEIANETLLKTLWKRELSDVQGKKLLDIFPELNDQHYPQLLARVLQTGVPHIEKEAFAYINSKEGLNKYYLDFEYSPLFETDGSVSGIMVTVSDVSEKVSARIQINEAEQRSRLAIEAAEMGTYDWDMVTHTFIHNDRLSTIFGLEPGQRHLQSAFRDVIHPDDKPIRAQAHQDMLTTGRLMYEVRLVWPDKSVHWVRVVGKIILDAHQNPARLLGTALDISQQVEARKNLEETAEELEKRVTERTLELQNTNRELIRTNHELEQFAYIASHDLQEPLRKIQTFTELLQDSLTDEQKTKILLQKVNSSAQRMSTLIRDVLNYSRLSRTDEQFVETDLSQILENVKTDFELLIEQKGALIIHPKLPVISAIPLQLSQLFSNLIGNSLKFSERAPIIQISSEILTPEVAKKHLNLSVAKAFIMLTFKDNGIGFEQQYAEQIFTIFHRLNGQKSYSGTGIGLALCKKIVENHKGFIVAQSAPGQGTSFTIYLPV
ncbi:PAS domain-containing protein [Larkinella arboricola]